MPDNLLINALLTDEEAAESSALSESAEIYEPTEEFE